MTQAAGKLNHRVRLESLQTSQDVSGDTVETWTHEGDVWANVSPVSGKEFIASAATQSKIVARITVRYRADIQATWRILFRGRYYNIEGVLPDVVSGLEYLTLPVSCGVQGEATPPAIVIPGGSEYAVLGDSITAAGRSSNATTYRSEPRGYSAWADILSGKRGLLEFDNNFGVSGDRTSQIAVRVPNVIATGSKMCVVLGGTNDATDLIPASTVIANLDGIYNSLIAAGLVVIGIPILPRGGAATLTSPQLAIVNQVNAWIRGQISRPMFRLADPVPDIEDTVTGGYVPKAGMMHDGLHPSAKGAYYVGLSVSSVIRSLFSEDPSLDNPGDLLRNPLFLGTAGTKTGLTGDVADGWAVTAANAGGATVVASKHVDDDGVTWQRFTFSGSYSGSVRFVAMTRNVTAGEFLSGDRQTIWTRVRVSPSLVGIRIPSVQLQMGTFTSVDTNLALTADDIPPDGWEGILRCFPFTLPSNSVAPRAFFNVPLKDSVASTPCSGYVEFAEAGLNRLT